MGIEKLILLLEGSELDGVNCISAAPEYGNGSAVEYETGLFLYSFVFRLKPLLIVETGTHWGFSGAFMALALAEHAQRYPNQSGLLYSIDMNGYEGRAERLWKRLGVDQFIVYHVGSSLEAPLLDPPISFLWLDADHETEFVIEEFLHFQPKLNQQSVWVGFHDTRLDVRMSPAVETIVQELAPKTHTRINHVRMRNLRGMDLIQLEN